ncbi:MAG TPA: D-alanine--D-alanine ligase family protein [Candidatus Saccharimonadales bacterium]|nr:D-alanine--D-alanine ligase family protein [Candidatus Saccharimonadales bacterium]
MTTKSSLSKKKTILLLFGGESSEHDVSIASAKNIFEALDRNMLHVLLGYIDRSGRWWHVTSIDRDVERSTPIQLLPGLSTVSIGGVESSVDVVFPVLHGQNGEDGTVQGLARLMHFPIVGCDMTSSLLCMDKPLAKQLLQGAGLPVVRGEVFSSNGPLPHFDELTARLGTVLFLKPARQGSSVGVGKATDQETFTSAFKEATKYDTRVLIESAIEKPRELEVAVLGAADNPDVSVVGEIIPDREFYTYESKYDSSSTSQAVIPATIDPEVASRVRALARQAYDVLQCQGLARVDFFLDSQGEIYINEINTMPGFTNISMYPKLWEASGLPYADLVAKLLRQAIM